jgi:hypothetical protein
MLVPALRPLYESRDAARYQGSHPWPTPSTDVAADEVAEITKAMPLVRVKWLHHCDVVCRMLCC